MGLAQIRGGHVPACYPKIRNTFENTPNRSIFYLAHSKPSLMQHFQPSLQQANRPVQTKPTKPAGQTDTSNPTTHPATSSTSEPRTLAHTCLSKYYRQARPHARL